MSNQANDPEKGQASEPINDGNASIVDAKDALDQQFYGEPPKPYKIGPLAIPHLRSTYTQVFIAGFVNFLAVGMYNVLTALGGAGQLDTSTADNANTILYCLFAVCSLIAGPFINYFGPRITMALGGIGFALYGSSFWSFNHNQNDGFVLFAGVACGIGAAFLWAAGGTIMTAYATEAQKGRFVSIFFFLSFFGAVIGGIIPVAENYSNTNAGSVSDGTYAALTVLMILSGIVAILVVNPEHIVRTDGTRVLVRDMSPNHALAGEETGTTAVQEKRSLLQEITNVYYVLNRDKWFLWFLPFSFSTLFYIAYQTNDFNGYFFNVRTRSINGLLYGISQLIGSLALGLFLDMPYLSRKSRARIGWVAVFVVIFVVSLCGYFPMKESQRGVPYDPPLDVNDGAKAAKYMALYFFFGLQDGMSQAYSFWIMGALSNDPQVLSMYAGLFKVMGATASAIGFAVDADKISYVRMYASYWSVSLFGCLSLVPLVFLRIKNTSE